MGRLILNADDWGRDATTTARIRDCARLGAVSAVSAMVFMAGSEEAAKSAREMRLDAGLHLNLTTPFDGPGVPPDLAARQRRIAAFLRGNRFAPAVYHPGLARDFALVVRAQLDEFERLYGAPPARVDGHHHMHLCANVQLAGLLPAGVAARRNFSFAPGEKSAANRCFRRLGDRWLARRHRLTDYFFSLPPLVPERLRRIAALAEAASVEVETHPVNPAEYEFLAGGEIFSLLGRPAAPAQ
jgi:predicted glycoside hydrolase/deacetylase ChbG (UPF0249 family)